MNRYAIAKIWEKFLIMLWLMKLEKEKKIPYPCFGSLGRALREKIARHFIPLAL